jgi:hypothetical protein
VEGEKIVDKLIENSVYKLKRSRGREEGRREASGEGREGREGRENRRGTRWKEGIGGEERRGE